MPIFEYQCSQCNAEFEKLIFSSDDTQICCPQCQSKKIHKKMSAVSLTGSRECGPTTASGGTGGFS
ncbi:MAG: transcriptional regulator [Desulfobacterales bacterium]|nr:MAG: transcriptional regulator [Desulfobacterales bacterium]